MLTTLLLSGIKVLVFRDDLNHATVSGNKLHKLAPNIARAKASDCSSVISFGGPYSNHLHALAWACKKSDLSSVGFVRGELHDRLTPTLSDCQKWGMQLIPLSRKTYRECQEILSVFGEPCLARDAGLQTRLQDCVNLNSALIVPEGGSNTMAIDSLSQAYCSVFDLPECQGVTHAVCATGTGATVAGLYNAASKSINVIGVQAVAEGDATLNRIKGWLGVDVPSLTIIEGHLGRFAKAPPKLTEFINQFESQHHIPLDPVYTGKAMFKLVELISAGYFKTEDKVLFIHTGGLQGKRS